MPRQFYLIVYCNQECLFFPTNKELYLDGRKPPFPDHALTFSRAFRFIVIPSNREPGTGYISIGYQKDF